MPVRARTAVIAAFAVVAGIGVGTAHADAPSPAGAIGLPAPDSSGVWRSAGPS